MSDFVASKPYSVPPLPNNEAQRLAALRGAMCAYVPREDRFDRITRMAQRMLHVPIALISIVEDDEQWFRSAQGLDVDRTGRDVSFCGHAIVHDGPFAVEDARKDPMFAQNPLVLGPPHIRSYLGWPLELAPGLRVGTLCIIDRMPRTFSQEDFEILEDLAHMAESELRVQSLASVQKALLIESSAAARKKLLDPMTGCWSERGFVELVRRAQKGIQAGQNHAALFVLDVINAAELAKDDSTDDHLATGLLLAQFIRQRVPAGTAVGRLSNTRYALLFAANSADVLTEQLEVFSREPEEKAVAGVLFRVKAEVKAAGMRLRGIHSSRDVDELLAELEGRVNQHSSETSFFG